MLNCLFAADKMGSMCLTIKYLGVLRGGETKKDGSHLLHFTSICLEDACGVADG